MVLTIYLIGFVLMLSAGLYYLREHSQPVYTGEVFAVVFYSAIWFVSVPVVIICLVFEQIAKLLTKDRK